MQQAGASRSAEQLRDGSPEYEAFENEADTAAAVAPRAAKWPQRQSAHGPAAARQIRSAAPAAEHQPRIGGVATPASGSG